MSVMNVNITKLEGQAERLMELIGEASVVLNMENPVSNLGVSLERAVSENATVIAANLQKIWSRGKIEEVVIGGALFGVAWLGAKAIDSYANKKAKKEAEQRLLGYYNQVVSKQNSIIDLQAELLIKQDNAIEKLQDDKETAAKELEEIKDKMAECVRIIQRINDFRKTVEY